MKKLLPTVLGALLMLASFNASADYVGEYAVGTDNICAVFNTKQVTTGSPFTIASAAVDVYKDDGETQDADDSGLTINEAFDTLTGSHQVCVDSSSDGTFYSAGSMFYVLISVGTVDSISVVGEEVMTFSLAKGPLASGAITATVIATDAIGAAEIGAAAINDSELNVTGSEFTAIDLPNQTMDITGTLSTVTTATNVTTVNGFANDALVAADIAADVTTELQSGLATAAALTTVDDFLDTEIFDIRRAIGPATTTIATLASQTSFTLTAGSADDNAYNGWGLVVVDASTAVQTALGCVLDYTGSTRTVTLRSDPGIFTMATTDNVILLPSFCTTGVDVSTIETVDATDQLDAHAAAGLDAAGVRSAVGLASANLDTQLSNIDNFVDTEVADILTDTSTTLDDFLDTEVAAILSDTNAILVDTSTTLDDFLDTEVAAILSDTNAILVDTSTTLDDFLDTEVAAILSDTNAILVDTGTTLDDFIDTEIAALMNARTQLFPGGVDADSVLTADSGDTNTLVDTELTFSAAQDIDGAYVVRSDGQRCEIDSFTPGTDTIEFGACTFTGAWSTQTYKIYPANTQ